MKFKLNKLVSSLFLSVGVFVSGQGFAEEVKTELTLADSIKSSGAKVAEKFENIVSGNKTNNGKKNQKENEANLNIDSLTKEENKQANQEVKKDNASSDSSLSEKQKEIENILEENKDLISDEKIEKEKQDKSQEILEINEQIAFEIDKISKEDKILKHYPGTVFNYFSLNEDVPRNYYNYQTFKDYLKENNVKYTEKDLFKGIVFNNEFGLFSSDSDKYLSDFKNLNIEKGLSEDNKKLLNKVKYINFLDKLTGFTFKLDLKPVNETAVLFYRPNSSDFFENLKELKVFYDYIKNEPYNIILAPVFSGDEKKDKVLFDLFQTFSFFSPENIFNSVDDLAKRQYLEKHLEFVSMIRHIAKRFDEGITSNTLIYSKEGSVLKDFSLLRYSEDRGFIQVSNKKTEFLDNFFKNKPLDQEVLKNEIKKEFVELGIDLDIDKYFEKNSLENK